MYVGGKEFFIRGSRVQMCVCCYTVRGRKCVCDCVSGWEARDSLEGVESAGVCVWVGFLEGRGVARLGDVGVSERPTNETHPVYLHIYCG